MGGPKSIEVELDKEHTSNEHLESDKELMNSIVLKQRSYDESDKTTDFQKVSVSEKDQMEKMLVYQDIADFFESKAEYEAACKVAEVEAYEYEYDLENIDELLDDIIDTAQVYHEMNLKRLCNEKINQILINMAKKRGLELARQTVVGRKKDGCVLEFWMQSGASKTLVVIENSAGKLKFYLDNEEASEEEKSDFEELYKKIHSQLSRNGITIRHEVYNV